MCAFSAVFVSCMGAASVFFRGCNVCSVSFLSFFDFLFPFLRSSFFGFDFSLMQLGFILFGFSCGFFPGGDFCHERRCFL